MAQILFNLFVLLTLVSAIGVVVNRNAVNSAMCLLLSLVSNYRTRMNSKNSNKAGSAT
jgi:NADH:ubiquinone oxidoreductase subunit 6 (subunit J)